MKLLKLYVKNYVKFKEAELNLDRIGITKIIGKNLDSNTKLVPADVDTNAVGKTALVSGISQLIFASTPVTQDIKSKAKKDVFKKKDSAIELTVKHENDEYVFGKHSNGKTIHYDIVKNGENTNTRTMKYPEEKIRSMFDMTEDEFYTLWSISSTRPSKLQYGSTASRFQFFTNFFKLNNHDELRKIFNSMLRESKEAKAALTEIVSQIEKLDTIDSSAAQELKTQIKSSKKTIQELSAEYSDLHEKKTNAALYENSHAPVRTLRELCNTELTSTRQIKKLITDAERIVYSAENLENYLENKAIYDKELKRYKEKKSSLKSKLKKYGKPDFDDYEKQKKTLNIEISKVKDTARLETDYDAASHKALKKKLKNVDISTLDETKQQIVARKTSLRETIEALESVSGCKTCPTCLSSLNESKVEKLLKQSRNDIEKENEKLESINQTLQDVRKLERLNSELENYEKKSAAKQSYYELKKRQEKLLKWDNYFSLLSEYENLEAPKEPKNTGEIFDYTKDDIENYKKIISVGALVLPIYEKYLDIENQKLHLPKIEKRLQRVSAELETLQSELPSIVSKLEVAKKNNELLVELEKRKKDLKLKAGDADILSMLTDAYSNKGIKLILIRYIASVIEKNMNQYAPLVYPEPIKFKFNVVNDREFSILREIKTKKGNETDDVRVLSGAESRAFSFLLPLAILPLIPKEKRLNVMILDEPTVNMGEARLELFTKNFIPKLNQIVPHLIIVSTGDENYQNCETFQIIKKGGISMVERA